MTSKNVSLELAKQTVRTLREEVGKLQIAIKKHGDHTRQCAVIQGGRYYMEPLECDCGFAELFSE